MKSSIFRVLAVVIQNGFATGTGPDQPAHPQTLGQDLYSWLHNTAVSENITGIHICFILYITEVTVLS